MKRAESVRLAALKRSAENMNDVSENESVRSKGVLRCFLYFLILEFFAGVGGVVGMGIADIRLLNHIEVSEVAWPVVFSIPADLIVCAWIQRGYSGRIIKNSRVLVGGSIVAALSGILSMLYWAAITGI